MKIFVPRTGFSKWHGFCYFFTMNKNIGFISPRPAFAEETHETGFSDNLEEKYIISRIAS